jgi:hypothetical protein
VLTGRPGSIVYCDPGRSQFWLTVKAETKEKLRTRVRVPSSTPNFPSSLGRERKAGEN